jgi:acyl carrier protein
MEITEWYCDAKVTGLVPDDEFVADLQIGNQDFLELVELLLQVQEEFDIKISDSRAEEMRTFSELVDEITLLQNEKV